jgi:hypothetical protein
VERLATRTEIGPTNQQSSWGPHGGAIYPQNSDLGDYARLCYVSFSQDPAEFFAMSFCVIQLYCL